MSEIGHNSGLVDPDVAAEAMRRSLAPWQDRRAEFERKANSAVVDCQDAAATAIDFVRKARALVEKAKALQVEVVQPYADAAGAARGVATIFTESLEASIRKVSEALRNYNEDRRQRAEQLAKHQAAEEAKLRQKAGAPTPSQIPTRGKRKMAPIRTDQGGLMVETDRWTVEVFDVAKIPVMVLSSPKVMDAIRIVARDFMKNGVEIPGCRKADQIGTIIR